MFQATLLIFCAALARPGLSSGGHEMPFGCREMNMDDQTRQGALDLINRIRSSVELGEFQANEFLSSASGMDKLRWDCSLEEIARRAVRNCPQMPTPSALTNAMNYRFFKPDPTSFTVGNSIESAVLQWSEIKNMKSPESSIFDKNQESRDFANLIHPNTSAVGCASNMCGHSAAAACVFSQSNVPIGISMEAPVGRYQKNKVCSGFSSPFYNFWVCVYFGRSTTKAPWTRTPRPTWTTPRRTTQGRKTTTTLTTTDGSNTTTLLTTTQGSNTTTLSTTTQSSNTTTSPATTQTTTPFIEGVIPV